MKVSEYVVLVLLCANLAVCVFGIAHELYKLWRDGASNRAIARMWRNKRRQKPLVM